MYHPTKDTLYYDGHCPLCSKEIGMLSRLTRGRVNFQDIHQYQGQSPERICLDEQAFPSMPQHDTPDKQSLLKVLHLQKADGQWLKGLDANVAVWRQTRLSALFLVFRIPVVKKVAAVLYDKWAEVRYKKLYSSREGDGADCGCKQPRK